MSFSVLIPADSMDVANATLQAAGWGPGNFSIPLRASGAAQGVGGSHTALHHIGNDTAFQAACAALSGAIVRTSPQLVVEFQQAVTEQALEWTDPANWYAAPIMIGAQKVHGGKTWESLVDYNVWEPPVAWREIVAEGYPAWVQPVGAVDAYPLGFRVTFNGQNWENTGSAANVWAPGVFGWVVVP